MDRTLVVGATGQLGTAAVKELRRRGADVRALVRSAEQAGRFRDTGVESVTGDLTDAPSLARACSGVGAIITTANAAIPSRRTDTFEAVERNGYRNLIQAATAAKVRRFIYTSVPMTKYAHLAPLIRFKRETEEALTASGLESVIFRADVFMDTAFAMMGSSIPLRGSEGATVLRPFAFANRHFTRIRENIEQKHLAMIPGDGTKRHSFICVEDVARFLASAVDSAAAGEYAVGGPEALTFLDVVGIYERILGVSLRVQRTPATLFRVAAAVLGPFSPAGGNLMALNYIAAMEETLSDPTAATTFNVRLTSAEEFLRAKYSAGDAAKR